MMKAITCALFGHRPNLSVFFTARQRGVLEPGHVLRPCTRCPVFVEVLRSK